MSQYQIIQPEVIVGLWGKTEFLEKEQPLKTVTKLHIKLEDWLGDDIMECYPCYLVTENLREQMKTQIYTGFEFEDVEVTMSEYFSNNFQLRKSIPKFYWLKITGKENVSDLYLGKEKKLHCSERLLHFLTNTFATKYLDIDPQRNEFDDLLDQMIKESKK